MRGKVSRLSLFCLMLGMALPALSQAITGTITGRATDSSNALIPGVEVTISSPAMIGGARSTVTDERGVYRFTQLPIGTYRVTFALPGFKTLNIDGIIVGAGGTMTINGAMEVASVAEEVTVTSQAPTIDLEATTVGVNWNQQNFENLPYGRAIRGLAQMLPGFYVQNYDVGGNTLGGSTTTGARAYGRTGNELIQFDGVVWDQFFGDYGTYEEVQISAAAKGAEASSPGATLSFVIKSGSNDFHGSAYAQWQDGKFQSNNVTQKLLDQGFTAGSNKFTHYDDYTFDIGGPILRDKLWFYGAYSHQYSGLFIPGFISEKTGQQAEFYTQLDNPTLKLTYQLTDSMKLEFTEQLNRKWQPYRTASEFTPLEATQNQIAWTAIGPSLKWTWITTPKMTIDGSVNRSGYWWPDYAWSTDVRKTDLNTGQIRGGYNQVYRRPIRWGWNGAWAYFTDIGGKNHEIKSGFLGYWSKSFVETIGYPPHQQVYRYRSQDIDGSNYFLRPNSVQVFDYPNAVASGVNYNSWFINDKITWNRKLTLNLGLRFDRYSSWLPEQGNPGTGPWATKKVYEESRDFPIYNSWSPRLSFIYDITGEGKLAFKASYGRYTGAGSGSGSANGPTASSVNLNSTRTCTYNNWNGTIPYIPNRGPDGILGTGDDPNIAGACSGGGTLRVLDSNLDNEYTDEYTAGIEVGLTRDYTFRFNVVRKMDFGGDKTIDLAQPFEAYTDVRTGVDRGRDNIAGTADDGVINVWSIPRTYPRFGQSEQVITNVDKDRNEGSDLYTAYELTFNKQYSNGWSFLGGYTTDFRKVSNNLPTNPNQAYYNWQLPEWNSAVKLNGTYSLPFGFMFASTYTAQSGAWYGREEQVRNALNSNVTVTVEQQAGRYDWVKLWDNRFSKIFRLSDRHSIEAMIDIFNTANSSVVKRREIRNGPNYLKPLATSGIDASAALPIVAPRIFRLGARWKF